MQILRRMLSQFIGRINTTSGRHRNGSRKPQRYGVEALEGRLALTSFISGDWGWVGSFGALASTATSDAEGNVYVAGSYATLDYRAPMDFDPGEGIFSPPTSIATAPQGIGFVAKLDAHGVFQWATTFGVSYGGVSFQDITVTPTGDLWLLGRASTTHAWASTFLTAYPQSEELSSLVPVAPGPGVNVAIRLDSTGSSIVAATVPSAGWPAQSLAYAPDLDGVVVVSDTGLISQVSRDGIREEVVSPISLTYDPAGTTASLSLHSLRIDSDGNRFISGRLRGAADFDPSASAHLANSGWRWGYDGSYVLRKVWTDDTFVAKYSPTNELQWVVVQGADNVHEVLEFFAITSSGESVFAASRSPYSSDRDVTVVSASGAVVSSTLYEVSGVARRLVGLTHSAEGQPTLITPDGLLTLETTATPVFNWRMNIPDGYVEGAHFDALGRAVLWSSGATDQNGRRPTPRTDFTGPFPLVSGTFNSGGYSGYPGTYIAVLDATAPRVASVTRHLPTSRVTAASTLQYLVTFTEAVSGVDAADFSVKGSTATVTAVDAQPDGSYLVTVTGGDLATVNGAVSLSLTQASGISDAALNLLVEPTPQVSDEDFLLDHASPVASIQPVSPSPRNSAVAEVAVTFTESVRGVSVAAFRLTKDGVPVSLANATVTGTGNAWALGNLSSLTGQSGDYELALVSRDSGVTDDAGNLLTGESKITWTVDATKPTASFAAVTPALRNTPVASVDIAFSEAVQALDALAFALTRNGVTVSLGSAAVSGSGKSWTLSGLSTATDANGDYVLELKADATVTDALGNTLAAGTSVAWTTDKTAPQASLAAVSPAVRNTPVQSLAVSFTKPVSGVTAAAFRVERDGVALPLSGLSVSGQGTEWVLTGLGSLTAAQGAYKLTLAGVGSGITDTVGNGLSGSVDVAWQADTTRPTVVLPAVSPSLRNTPVAGRRLTFSESVQNLGLEDFVLTRNGLPVSLAQASLTGDADKWTLSGLTSANSEDGVYSLGLTNAATVSDAAGNLVDIPTSISWTIDRTVPTAAFTAVSPTLRNTAVSDVGISFSEPVANVVISDLVLTRDGASIPLTGASVSGSGRNWTINGLGSLTATAGTYVLAFKPSNGIADAAGNTLGNVQATGWEHMLTVAFGQVPATNKVVARNIDLFFNAAVTGVTLGNVQLTRNGKSVKLVKTKDVSLTGSGNRYVLTLPASVAKVKGTYVLSLGGPTSPITTGLRTLSQRFSATWRYL